MNMKDVEVVKTVKNLYSYICININGSNRKAMNRNWSNQKANLALKTKAGNK